VAKLVVKLEEMGLAASGVSISASDETSIDIAVLSLKGYSPTALQALSQINAHSVSSQTRRTRLMARKILASSDLRMPRQAS
jgi:hypothetical protein